MRSVTLLPKDPTTKQNRVSDLSENSRETQPAACLTVWLAEVSALEVFAEGCLVNSKMYFTLENDLWRLGRDTLGH